MMQATPTVKVVLVLIWAGGAAAPRATIDRASLDASLARGETLNVRGFGMIDLLTMDMLHLSEAGDDFVRCSETRICYAYAEREPGMVSADGYRCESKTSHTLLKAWGVKELAPMANGHKHLIDHRFLRAVYMIDPEAIRQATVCSNGNWHVLSHSDVPYGNYGANNEDKDRLPPLPSGCRFDSKTCSL